MGVSAEQDVLGKDRAAGNAAGALGGVSKGSPGTEPARTAMSDSFRRGEDGAWVRVAAGQSEWATRALDILMSFVALVLTAPLMAVVAVLVRLDSPGPSLFFNKRVGLNGRAFWLIKFRTHFSDAAERFPELCSYDFKPEDVGDVRIQFEGDPRVTHLGRWLRRTSIDELPNFWNVLVGEMTLVGPRPELWSMLRYYDGEWLEKFTVKPGVTGLAQVRGRGNLTVAETNALDVEYVRTRSFRLDMRILFETVWQVFAQRDAL